METYISTAALRDHAMRVSAAAHLAVSGAGQVAVNRTFTFIVPEQDRRPRGVDR
jgi:hypothetical protein